MICYFSNKYMASFQHQFPYPMLSQHIHMACHYDTKKSPLDVDPILTGVYSGFMNLCSGDPGGGAGRIMLGS